MTSADARIERLERQVEALLAKIEEQAAEILFLWTRVLFHNWHRVRDGTMSAR